jgi:hypothetical protein
MTALVLSASLFVVSVTHAPLYPDASHNNADALHDNALQNNKHEAVKRVKHVELLHDLHVLHGSVLFVDNQTVTLVDLLVEGQTLYTMAVEKQAESVTAALELARQAERAVAADTVKKRLAAGARADPQDLTVLGALRARVSTLTQDLEKRREYFDRQFDNIQDLVHRKRFDDAQMALDRLPADTPTADAAYPFANLRADVDRAMAARRAEASVKASRPASHRGLVVGGILTTAALVGAGVAVHHSMADKYYEMSFLPPGSYEWWNLNDAAEGQRKARNGLFAAAVGVGAAFAIIGAVTTHPSANRTFSPFGPRTWVGFSIDPRRPSITVVKVF